jgi:hypothetical protein
VEKFGQVDFDPAHDGPFVLHDVRFCVFTKRATQYKVCGFKLESMIYLENSNAGEETPKCSGEAVEAPGFVLF